MVPEKALTLAKHFEGLFLHAYLCPARIWTIGYGHTAGVKPGDVTTEPRATEDLSGDIIDAVNGALRCCPTLALYPDRLAAIADFVYNLGETRLKASTLRRKVNEGNWNAAREELKKWVWGGGKKLPGLVLRRETEGLLLVS
jgi:lysozyme